MAEELKPTLAAVIPEPKPEATPQPQANTPEARNPDGTLKDPALATLKTQTENSETKPEAKPEAKDPTKDPAKPEGAPEKYADFKAPEGFELDPKALEVAAPIFKELNLSQEGAQKLIDFYAQQSKDAAEAPIKFYAEMRNGWRDTVIKNPELGNGRDGLKPEVSAHIAAAIDAMPNAKEFRAAMTLTGAGDNPAFVAAMNWLGQQLSEGTLVPGSKPSPGGTRAPNSGPKSPAEALYPHLASGA
jgi:hypothetical protein